MAIALPVVDQARRSAQASPQQISQAQRTGQQLLAFVADRSNKVPPIWASVSAQGQASQARASLQGGRARPGDPRWRIGGSDATMTANMGIDGSDARRLRVELVWRDQRWLVQSLALEPGA